MSQGSIKVLLQQEQRQVISQRIDPKIILANSILQLSTMELVQSIESELLENPALDTVEDSACAGDCIDPSTCPYCCARKNNERTDDQQAESLDSGDREAEYEGLFDSASSDAEDEYDPVGNLEAELTLQEHLRNLLRAAVPAEQYWIGEYLIDCLDDRGWLEGETEIIALDGDAGGPRHLGVAERRNVLEVAAHQMIRNQVDPIGGRRGIVFTQVLQLKQQALL